MTDHRLAEYEARRRLERRRRSEPRSRPSKTLRDSIRQHACRVCGTQHQIEVHHIVPRSKFGKRDHSVHSRENLMPLCHRHHQDHHTTPNRVPRHLLSAAEYEFAVSHTSPAWVDRWYPKFAPGGIVKGAQSIIVDPSEPLARRDTA